MSHKINVLAICTFLLTLSEQRVWTYLKNLRWPPSSIFDFCRPSKITEWPDELILIVFWSSMIACNVSAKEFMFNQSITGGHLKNVKMAKIAYWSDQSCPNIGFGMPKSCNFAFHLSGWSLFWNSRWPPSAILFWSDDKKNVHFTFTGSNGN